MPINNQIDKDKINEYCDTILAELYSHNQDFKNSTTSSFDKLFVKSEALFQKYNIPKEQGRYALELMEHYELITLHAQRGGGWTMQIKKEGETFHDKTSFKEEAAKEALQQHKEDIDFEKIKLEVKVSKWLLRTKWLPLIVSAITAFWTLFIFFNERSKNTQQQQQIEELQKIIPATKNEILRVVDSLYRIEHSQDTSKTK